MTETTMLFADALDLMSEQVETFSRDAWSSASPCASWTALDVLSHVTGTVQKSLGLLGGGDYAATPGEPAGAAGADEVVALWEQSAARAADAIVSADPEAVASTPRGDMPVREALALPTADLAVHAWDLAASAGRDLDLPDELRGHVERLVSSMPEEMLRGESTFGPAVEPPEGASATGRLMAFLGRRRP